MVVFSHDSASRPQWHPHVDVRRQHGRDAVLAVLPLWQTLSQIWEGQRKSDASPPVWRTARTPLRIDVSMNATEAAAAEAPAPPRLMTHSRTCAAAPCTPFLCVREVLFSSTRGFASLIQIHNSKGQFGRFSAAGSVVRSRNRPFKKTLNA